MIKVVSSEPRVANRQLPLEPVERPTVVVLCGTLGAGKTALAEGVLSQSLNKPVEKGMILNDPNLSVAQADAARIPRSVATQTLDGCACCSSISRLRQHLTKMLEQDKKRLIIVEGSGVTDGSELKRHVQEQLRGSSVDVFSICLVDGSKVTSAPTTVLASALISADCVVISHSSGDVGAATGIVKSIRGTPPDYIQSAPGAFDADLWKKLITSHSSRVASAPSDLGKYQKERSKLAIHSLALIGWDHLNRDALVRALSESPVVIERAKGTLKVGGQWNQIQYALLDNGRARLAIVPSEPPSVALLGGRPHLFVQSTQGAPQASDFLAMGMPDFSEKTVSYYLALYPGSNQLQQALGKSGVQVKSDGDMLFHSACGLFSKMQSIPESCQGEYIAALSKLLTRFISWRLEVQGVIEQEQGKFVQPDTEARKVLLNYQLCWTLAKFGGALENREFFGDLLTKTLAARPASKMFAALANLKRIGIYEGVGLTEEQSQNLLGFAGMALNYEKLDKATLARFTDRIAAAASGDRVVIDFVNRLRNLTRV